MLRMFRRAVQSGLVFLCFALVSGCGGDPFSAANGAAGAAGEGGAGVRSGGASGATGTVSDATQSAPDASSNMAGASSSGVAAGGAASAAGGSASSSTAGASGQTAGGAGGSGGSSARSCPSATASSFELGYFPELRDASSQESHPFFQLTNHGATVALNRITLRYYFTNDSGEPETAVCYWVTGDHCSLANMKFADVAEPTADAARYLEVSFPMGASVKVVPGVFEVRVGFKAGSSPLVQSNDYSFDSDASAPTSAVPFPYKRWLRATMYFDQKLVWGTEPCSLGGTAQLDQ